MEVIIRSDPDAAAGLVAEIVERTLREAPNAVLGLATGRTMDRVYGQLVRRHRETELDFSGVRTFNLDEYVGLDEADPGSYRYYMNERLFSRINIPAAQTHLPDGMAEDLDAECARYEALIDDVGGIDLQILGIGAVGHIGFNEPLSALRSRTRVKALAPQTLEQNAPMFGGVVARVPHRAITMGVGTILDSRR